MGTCGVATSLAWKEHHPFLTQLYITDILRQTLACHGVRDSAQLSMMRTILFSPRLQVNTGFKQLAWMHVAHTDVLHTCLCSALYDA